MQRATKPPQFGTANLLGRDFDQAYAAASAHVDMLSTHAGTPFTVEAGVVTRGKHKDELFLLFKPNGKERTKTYKLLLEPHHEQRPHLHRRANLVY